MGNTNSKAKEIATFCKYNKKSFRKQIDMVHDAHNIVVYYSKFLLYNKVPMDLGEYVNYDDDTENYFNIKRKESIPELNEYCINTYYDFYKMLEMLPRMYKKPETTEIERKELIIKYVEISQAILKSLVEELNTSCDIQ
jgi:hypothetical protein